MGRDTKGERAAAGQPAGYTIQTLHDFAAACGRVPTRGKQHATMCRVGESDDEKRSGGGGVIRRNAVDAVDRVVEADKIPEAHLEQGGMYKSSGRSRSSRSGPHRRGAGGRLSGQHRRNPRSGFVAYVPVGSLEKGKQLVQNGGGKTMACATCHGPTLQGLVNIPDIASRSPSYMMRQMWDMKMGVRRGPMTQLMKSVVANLTQDDMLNVSAYLASIKPAAATTTSSR